MTDDTSATGVPDVTPAPASRFELPIPVEAADERARAIRIVFKRRGQCPDGQQRPSRDRRRTSRQPAGWESGYVVVDGSQEFVFLAAHDYSPCVLQDLSMDGAGLELPAGDLAIGDRVVLNLQLGERQRASIRLTGEIRHATPDPDGMATAGVEFVDVGDLERALLLRLLRDMKTGTRQSA